MKKIVIIGSTGLLGSSVSKYFIHKENYEVWLTYKTPNLIKWEKSIYYNPVEDFSSIKEILECSDYAINCIGVINKHVKNNESNTIFLNSWFPHKLAEVCNQTKTKLIHITTDCVFSGKKGDYNEEDFHDSTDVYGKSKSIGEPKKCMVLRTSIIGRELHNYDSLIEWAISMKGKEVNGFLDHIWNGVTTQQYAKCCDKIISNELYEDNLFHIFSNKVTKNQLLHLFNKKWKLDLKIRDFFSTESIDRSLSTIKNLNKKLEIPSIEEQVKNL